MTTPLLDNETRRPVSWLNYRGRVDVDPTRPFGPRYMSSERVWPVTADYDPDTDVTRVGVSYIPPQKDPA